MVAMFYVFKDAGFATKDELNKIEILKVITEQFFKSSNGSLCYGLSKKEAVGNLKTKVKIAVEDGNTLNLLAAADVAGSFHKVTKAALKDTQNFYVTLCVKKAADIKDTDPVAGVWQWLNVTEIKAKGTELAEVTAETPTP